MTAAFDRLHSSIKQILWDMRWSELRPFQVETINQWFDGTGNIIIMANTAAGKTEAAFLPVISSIASTEDISGIRALYVGPLKALINDQFRRLEDLCKRADIPVHRWHGDVSASRKKNLLKKPSGILLITPESLEAMFMKQGRQILRLFQNLEAVVIDEQHVFLESDRGRQLSSLLNRLDRATNKSNRRIGLSATIGDKEVAQDWISGSRGQAVVVESKESQEIQLLLNSFVGAASKGESKADAKAYGLVSVAEYIFEKLSGKTNLVFCNKKEDVESLSDMLRHICKDNNRPNEFLVHHGSLSKEIRSFTEEQLQSSRACTAVCSSTLELGIDVGNVDNVVQVGSPHGVSSLKQRLGRSGRRGDMPARIHICLPMPKCDERSFLPDQLYPQLIQSIAVVALMLGKRDDDGEWMEKPWLEPPTLRGDDLSTLVQQSLSIIIQHGGATASALFDDLCVSGPFNAISQDDFIQMLKDLGQADLVEQTSSGDLILGLQGEKLASSYEFYSAFETPDSYHVRSGSDNIGSIDGLPGLYKSGQHILLAGLRWEIVDVDEDRMAIEVKRAQGKQPVKWFGGVCDVHPRIRAKMLEILCGDEIPVWLEDESRTVLQWARESFRHLGLECSPFVQQGRILHVFTWTGSKANNTLEMVLLAAGLSPVDVYNYGIGLYVSSKGFNIDSLRDILQAFVSSPPDGQVLVEDVFGELIPPLGKYAQYLSPALRAQNYVSGMLDISGAVNVATQLLKN